MGRLAVVCALLVALLAACAQVSYTPNSVTSPKDRLTQRAVVCYEGDLATLERAGGQVHGRMRLDGNGYSTFTALEGQAQHEAAEKGGTHVLMVDREVEVSEVQMTPDTATTRRTSPGNYQTTYTPGVRGTVRKPSASFLVVRVPPARWGELPGPLRPVAAPGVSVEPAPAQARCAERRGRYTMTFVERRGDCGPVPAATLEVAEQPKTVEPPCEGSITYSEDNCRVHYDIACPLDGGGVRAVSGDVRWSEDGSEGRGIEGMSVRTPDGKACKGAYETIGVRR